MKLALACLVLVIGCGGDKEKDKKSGGKSARDELGDSKVKIAELGVKKLAMDAFPRWSLAHTDKACPASLAELVQYVGGPKDDAIDPWGNPYKMLCGDNLPPGAKGFAVLSFGEDGKEGTDDDVKSWEKPKG